MKSKEQVIVLAHNTRSKSAKAISRSFGTRQLAPVGHIIDLAVANPKTIVLVNWGYSGPSQSVRDELKKLSKRIINQPNNVESVRNKLKFFKLCSETEGGPRIPKFWTDVSEAMKFINDNPNKQVIGRQLVGSCGEDIVFFSDGPDQWNKSAFWVQYKPKKDEFRVHLFKIGNEIKVIAQQRKALRATDPVSGDPIDKTKVDFKIRNLRHGFIFQRNNITVPEDVIQQSIKALVISGLDFGAVDVIWNEKEQKAYVLEINSAPGLEGQTIVDYTTALSQIVSA